MFRIYYGDDDLAREEAVARLRADFTDEALGDLNISVLDGNELNLVELQHVCNTVPFLAKKRLVIVHGLLTRYFGAAGASGSPGADDDGKSKDAHDQLVRGLQEYLHQLPPTTELLLVEPALLKDNAILRLAHELGGQEAVQIFAAPRPWELERWIQTRAEKKGGRLAPDAARRLATLVGSDLRLLDQELEKLLLSVEPGQLVTEDAVNLLVSYVREESIFDLVDAVGQGQAPIAFRILHRLREDNVAPLYILTMIIRQFRLLLQTRELMEEGASAEEVSKALNLHPYVARKCYQQARTFTMKRLEASYERLAATDVAIKSGEIGDELAVQLLVAELCQAPTT